MFPLVFAWLTGKQTELYDKMVTLVVKKCREIGVDLQPKCIMSDFDTAAIKSFAIFFPNAESKGCYFHFCQAVWRKWSELGLSRSYQNEKVKKWYKQVQALAFVPLDTLIEAFTYLHDKTASLSEKDINKKSLEEFCD